MESSCPTFPLLDLAHILDECACDELKPYCWNFNNNIRFSNSIAISIDPTEHGESMPSFDLEMHLQPLKDFAKSLGIEVLVDSSGSGESLRDILASGHLITVIYHHGTEDGILCSDGILSYDELVPIPVSSGCLISMSCNGNNGLILIEDEYDEYVIQLPELLEEKQVACGIITIDIGHYLPNGGEAKLLVYLLDLLLNNRFEVAMEKYRNTSQKGSYEHMWLIGDMDTQLTTLTKL